MNSAAFQFAADVLADLELCSYRLANSRAVNGATPLGSSAPGFPERLAARDRQRTGMMSSIYTAAIDPEDDVYELDAFREHCKNGSFIDYDGMGVPAKGGMKAQGPKYWVYPSTLATLPADATHVVWYNR